MTGSINNSQRLQDHYEDPYHRGRCERTTHVGEASCACSVAGEDVLAVELCLLNGVLEEAWFDGDGCQLSMAFASMLFEQVEAKNAEEILTLGLDQAIALVVIDVEPERRNCCQVVLEAIEQAVKSPLHDELDSPTFLGPDLGDEC